MEAFSSLSISSFLSSIKTIVSVPFDDQYDTQLTWMFRVTIDGGADLGSGFPLPPEPSIW